MDDTKLDFGKPRQDYIDKIRALEDKALAKECNHTIWLSAYAGNNPRSDYHWRCDAVYDECVRRGRLDIYKAEHEKLVREY